MVTDVMMQEDPEPVVDAAVFRLDGKAWLWVDDGNVFFRQRPGDLPEEDLDPLDGEAATFFRELLETRREDLGTELRVTRGVLVRIGPVPFPSLALLEAIEEIHGALAWHLSEGALLAWSSSGEIVAGMMLPQGVHAFQAAPLQYDGAVWLYANTVAYRYTPSEDGRAQVEADAIVFAAKNSDLLGKLDELFVRGRSAAAVTPRRDGDFVHVGATRILAWHFLMVHVDRPIGALSWRFVGPGDPVVAFEGNVPVAMVMPLLPEVQAPGGQG